MELRINLFYLIMIAGIATSSMKDGRTPFPSRSGILSNELQVDTKSSLKWEGLLLHHKTFSPKKHFSDRLLEGCGQLIPAFKSFGYFIKGFLFLPILENLFYHDNTINAP